MAHLYFQTMNNSDKSQEEYRQRMAHYFTTIEELAKYFSEIRQQEISSQISILRSLI